MYIINKKRNFKSILIILVTAILNSVAMVSCVKDKNLGIEEDSAQFSINIKTESFGDDGVKSSNCAKNNILFTDTIITKFGPAQIILSEDTDNSNTPNTKKTGAISYKIKVYKKSGSSYTYVKYIIPEPVNNEGDFKLSSTPSLSNGTYAFVCVSNEAVSNNTDYTAVFSQSINNDIAPNKIAMISQVIEKTITNANEKVVLDFLMHHVQTGFRVQITSPIKDINIYAEDVIFNSDRQLTYNLSSRIGTLTNGATNKKPTKVNLPISSNDGYGAYSYTMLTDDVSKLNLYIYNNGNRNIEERFTISHKFSKNKRYNIFVSIFKSNDNDLTPEEVKELPGWRWAPREVETNSMKLRYGTYINDKSDYDEGAWMLNQAQSMYGNGKEVLLRDYYNRVFDGKKYHLPNVRELTGILPFYVTGLNFYAPSNSLEAVKETFQIGDKIYPQYDCKYWVKKITGTNTNNTDMIKYDVYGIKLYDKSVGDYSKACAYRYKWFNYKAVEGNNANAYSLPSFKAYVKISIIYLGSKAKYYLQNTDAVVDLFTRMDNGNDILPGFQTNTIIFNGDQNYGYYAYYPYCTIITNEYTHGKDLLTGRDVYSVYEGLICHATNRATSYHDYDGTQHQNLRFRVRLVR